MSKRVKILYMTQAAVSPPTFILFTDRAVKLHFSYQRFLENQIRAAFGFVGTPIWIKNRGATRGVRGSNGFARRLTETPQPTDCPSAIIGTLSTSSFRGRTAAVRVEEPAFAESACSAGEINQIGVAQRDP